MIQRSNPWLPRASRCVWCGILCFDDVTRILLCPLLDALKAAGVSEVIVFCVNDGAVMQGWAENQGVSEDSLLTFMADPYSEVTRALEMELTHPGPLSLGLVNRCKRFALHIVDGVVKAVKIAEGPDDPAGDDNPYITCAPSMLEIIKGIGSDEL